MTNSTSPHTIITELSSEHSTAEAIAARYHALLQGISLVSCRIDKLEHHKDALKNGLAMPVGSVEFLLQAMELAGKNQPRPMSYPESAQKYLNRKIWRTTRNQVAQGQFVKPFHTKIFTGFVLGDPHIDQETLQEFEHTPPDTPVWASEPVQFLSEWRFYVQGGIILGGARYDPDGEDDAPAPSPQVVSQCVDDIHHELGHPFVCDMGVLSNGQTALVEVNDAWAVGLYGRCIEPSQYINFLFERWKSI